MRLIFEQIRTGGDRNFGYLIGNGKEAVLIDPSYSPEVLVERAEAQGLKVHYILNTHGHHDHTNGNAKAQKLTGAELLPPKEGSAPLGLQLLETPGHAPDHIVIFSPKYKIALTGDHLFVGKIGGTSNEKDSREQFDNLHRLFNELPLETTIWPGHDYGCRPSSTLALEKECNPFITDDFDKFLDLKVNWSTFKKQRGLK